MNFLPGRLVIIKQSPINLLKLITVLTSSVIILLNTVSALSFLSSN